MPRPPRVFADRIRKGDWFVVRTSGGEQMECLVLEVMRNLIRVRLPDCQEDHDDGNLCGRSIMEEAFRKAIVRRIRQP